MIFSSILFLTVFLPVFLLIYFLLPKKLQVKHIFLLIASFSFYAWGEPKVVGLIFCTTLLDYFLVRKMDTVDHPTRRKIFLAFPILLNVGLLFYFKYANFFVDNLNSVTSLLHLSPMHLGRIILPIGISFYTFESITYAVDVYRRVHKPLDKFWEYQMYIIFFPKLIAGPIVRYHEIADQLQSHIRNETFQNRIQGFIRFSIGLGKKVLIANVMSRQADAIFAMDASQLTTLVAWAGALAYTLQIYFDFSGYSDMAIGISRMLGFKLPENFNNPYISKSVTEFWRRWHITLGNWMKNYLYIPLGGNKVAVPHILLNLFIVFVISGLWHGANWNFVAWGVYYGVFLIVERLLRHKSTDKPMPWIRQVLGLLYTFVVVTVGWVLFRQEHVADAVVFIGKMFTYTPLTAHVFVPQPDFIVFLVLGLALSLAALHTRVRVFQDQVLEGVLSPRLSVVFTLLGMVCFFVCLVSLSGGQFNPFIYFKF